MNSKIPRHLHRAQIVESPQRPMNLESKHLTESDLLLQMSSNDCGKGSCGSASSIGTQPTWSLQMLHLSTTCQSEAGIRTTPTNCQDPTASFQVSNNLRIVHKASW